jgi:DNA repair exonuclease SbcCD ATPase subunit
VRFTTASLEVENARASGDDARLRRALAAAQAQAGELERLDRRVQEVGEELEAARQAFLSALDDRLAVLYAELEATPSLESRRQIGDLIRDLQTQVTEVESEVDFASQIQLVAMPEVQFDPRDGPEELRLKAQIAESWVDRYDSQLELIDETIEELRERQRRERDFEQFMAGIRRFDDATVPVVAPPPSNPQPDPAQAGVSDSTAVSADGVEVSLEDQIGQLLILRSQVENYREQVRIRARVFRQRLGGITG